MNHTSHHSKGRLTKKSALAAVAALALFATTTGFSASASEQLEKAIYTEETKGDIDAAMRLYEGIIADAKAARALAAQAQYRLGLCLLKKKDEAGAQVSFEKVIEDYADQPDIVAKVQQHLPGHLQLLPVPWADGEVLQFVFKLPGGMEVGTAAYSARKVEIPGRKVWEVGARTFAGTQAVSRVLADAETFRPIRSRWNVFLLGDAEAEYQVGGVVMIQVKGKEGERRVPLEKPVFDNEQVVHVMRRLPLAVGYQRTLLVLSTHGGPAPIPIKLEVLAKEPVEVPAGKYEAFKVELNVGQTFWIAADDRRYLLKFEGSGAAGELVAVTEGSSADQVLFRDEALGFSFSAPGDAIVYNPKPKNDARKTVTVLDADTISSTTVEVHKLEAIPAEAKVSPRAWAESGLKELAQHFKEVAPRADTWQNRTVAGRPAVSVAADYVDQKRNMVFYGTCVLSGATGTTITGRCEADEFDELKKQVDEIIATYQAK